MLQDKNMISKQQLREHYNRKYSNDSFKDVKPVRITSCPADRFEAAVYWAGEGDKLLEIGCGSGRVLLTLMNRYKECMGVEYSEMRAREAEKLFSGHENVRIITGDIESNIQELNAGYFDTIIMIDVVEHLISPIRTLKYLSGLLKPGGKMVIATLLT